MDLKKHGLIITSFLSFAFFTGCLRPIMPPPSSLDLSKIDTSILTGKTIVIDPGHGGTELGAVGAKGLKESEVNLAVSLYLWGLLNAAGARPVLTRSSDHSIASSEDFLLKNDLQARSDLSNSYDTDLFVSIHHNSDINNRKRNDLDIFFKMSDAERSRDIARELCKTLKEKLKTDNADSHPGNYHVLRNTEAPAVLGEASFMTNKANELMLSFYRTLSLEAEGYFIGILNYFQKGIPCITSLYPKDVTLTDTQPKFTAHISPGTDSASINPSSIKTTLDGKNITYSSFTKEGVITFSPETPLKNNMHRFCISARNRSGNSSGEECASFIISLPPHHIKAVPIFPVLPPDGMSGTPIDIKVLDTLNRPVIDGTEVKLSATGGDFLNPMVLTKNGKARAILISDEQTQETVVTAKSGNATAQCRVRFGTANEAMFMATIRDTYGIPVEEVKLFRDRLQVDLSDSRGFVYDRVDADKRTNYKIVKKGYYPLRFSPHLLPGKLTVENCMLEPIDKGVFFSKKIILDPGHSSIKSLPIILGLKKKIETAGGTAILTWEKLPSPSAQTRVVKAGKEKADIFLTVEITKKKGSADYYFKSVRGKELAALLCDNLNKKCKNIKGKCGIATSARYVIIHTSMPAIWLSLPESSITCSSLIAGSIYDALVKLFQ